MHRPFLVLMLLWLLPSVVRSQSAVGSEFLVNSYTTTSQDFASAAMDADGDFVVVWQGDVQDGSSFGVSG